MSKVSRIIRAMATVIVFMMCLCVFRIEAAANVVEVEEINAYRGYDLDGFPLVCTDDWLFQIKADEAVIIAYLGTDTSIQTPTLVWMDNHRRSFPVRAIGQEAFAKSNNNFSKAKSILKATKFDKEVHNCSFKSLAINDSINAIGDNAFNANSEITTIKFINDSGKDFIIGNNAFRSCKALAIVSLPSGLTSIGTNCFYECTSLEKIVIPSRITEIPSGCFEKCTSLKTVSIPNGLQTLSNRVFFNCSNLENVVITGGGAHAGINIDLPDTVTTIGNSAFEYCIKIETVHIPTGISRISSRAFAHCIVLRDVAIPENVKTIDSYAFAYRVYGEEYEFDFQRRPADVTPVTFTEGLKTIGPYAFYDIPIMREVSIPYSVESIGANAFGYYESKAGMRPIPGFGIKCFTDSAGEDYAIANSFNVDPETKVDMTVEYKNVSFSTTEQRGEVTLTHVDNADITSYKVPKTIKVGRKDYTVTAIGDGAFSDCKLLKTVTIEEEVQTIGARAFSDCTALETVKIGDKLTTIEDEAFKGCKKLTTLTIGSGIQTIGSKAFYKCKKLGKITIKSSKIKKIGSKAFKGTSKKSEYTLPSKKLKSYKKKFKKAGAPKTVTYKKLSKNK
ncbi:leucine-rich repeat domain-containing protein [Butyrivibrio sp. LC3010]|uniref:leucine-rich repeat domain-containing protein n=1 Tax=Butyrivibrio sp. LC3010 TaxID=1280680 RepID=UPI00040DBE4A|nr:leucine-rich repeat domain-containing protein [Butyrivibrio sp. LC3010]